MLRWVNECLRAYTNRERCLLVMDSFRCHIMDTVKKSVRKANAETAIIPGGCTSVLQPLDVSVNKPFKGWLRASWSNYIRGDAERVENAKKGGDMLAKIRPPSKQLIVDWVASAVNNLKGRGDLVRKSFVVTGIAPAINGAQDHLVRKDDVSDDVGGSDTDSDTSFYGFAPEDTRTETLVESELSDANVSDVSSSSD